MLVSLLLSFVLGTSTVTTTKTSNGTTLPFQRHVVRTGPATAGAGTLAAVLQRQGTGAEGLVMYVSTDGGVTWARDQAVQNDPAIRDILSGPAHMRKNLATALPAARGMARDYAETVVYKDSGVPLRSRRGRVVFKRARKNEFDSPTGLRLRGAGRPQGSGSEQECRTQ